MSLPSRFVERLNRYIKAGCYTLRIENLLYPKVRNKDAILLFHSVLDNERADINIRNTSTATFEKIISYLSKYFSVVSLSELVSVPGNRPRIAITFDDGLINNLRYAVPVLEKYAAPATIFITTTYLRGESILWPDRWSLLSYRLRDDIVFDNQTYRKSAHNTFRNKKTGEKLTDVFLRTNPEVRESFFKSIGNQLNYNPADDREFEDMSRIMKGEEIRLLSQSPVISIGSHCVSHENLLLLSSAEVLKELTESKRYLEQVQPKTIDSIAFPFGLYNKNIMELAEKAGYRIQLAVNYLHNDDKKDPRIHDRIGLYNDLTVFEQIDKIQRALR